MSDCPDNVPPDESEVKQALDLLTDNLPALADEIDRIAAEQFAHGVAAGLELALGPDRAAAVLAGLTGEDPGTRVARQVRSRDLQTVRRNSERMRER